MQKTSRQFDDAKMLFVVVVHNDDGTEIKFKFVTKREADRFELSLKEGAK
jgi:hypothetical protein